MARIRTIKPEFWTDSKIAKLSRDARLLYIGLWNLSDDAGVVSGNTFFLKSQIYPFDQIQIQQFEKWLEELVKLGFISLFSHNGEKFYYLPNLTRHQKFDPRYPKLLIDRIVLDGILREIDKENDRPAGTQRAPSEHPAGAHHGRGKGGVGERGYSPNGFLMKKNLYEEKTKKPNARKNRDFETGKYGALGPTVKRWLAYKAEIGDGYKSQDSCDTMARNLWKLSGGDADEAMKIVEQSIGNNWKGIFKLKNDETGRNASNRDTEKARRDRELSDLVAEKMRRAKDTMAGGSEFVADI